MAELKFLSEDEPRNVIGDWTIRGGVAVVFVIFGLEKFSEDPVSHWVRLFNEIGWGDWFRYLTGWIELVGGLLVLIPRAALVGLALLALTMASAVAILAFLLGQPGESVFPGIFFMGLVGVGIWMRHAR